MFEDLITGSSPDDTPAPIDPHIVVERLTRKGLQRLDTPKPATDFGANDDVIEAPRVAKPRAQKPVSFGDDDEIVQPVEQPAAETVPLPRPRPADAPSPTPLIAPTATIPPVQPMDDAPLRGGGRAIDAIASPTAGMLTGEEAFDQNKARIEAADKGLAEARTNAETARKRYDELLKSAPLTGDAGDVVAKRNLRKQAQLGEMEQRLKDAEAEVEAARKAPFPTQGSTRDTLERIPDAATGLITDTARGAARATVGALRASDAAVSWLGGIKPGTETFDTADKALDAAARNVKNYVGQDLFKKDESQNEKLGSKLVQGVVSTGVFAAGGAAGKALGLSPTVVTALMGAFPQAEQQFQQAQSAADISPEYAKAWLKNYGVDATTDQANAMVKWSMFAAGVGIGATEAVPIGHMFERLEKASGGGLTRYLGIVAAQAGEEAVQEGVQQLLQNAATRGLLDPNQKIDKDVAENMLVGALSGGIVTGVLASPTALKGHVDTIRDNLGIPTPEAEIIPPKKIMEQAIAAPPKTLDTTANPQPMTGPIPVMSTPPTTAEEITLPPNNDVQIQPETAPEEITPPAPSPDAAILREYGYTDDQIADMSDAQRKGEVQDAIESGINPDDFGSEDHAVGSRSSPLRAESAEDIARAASVVDAEPSDAQKAAGNYQKQHVKWNGLDITIENPKGSNRAGKSPDGSEWSVTMPGHYGYLKRTKGADGDQVDVYIGDHLDPKGQVFVVDQKDAATGKFDEHKVIMGARSEDEARALYEAGFSDGLGAQRNGGITAMSPEEFKAWLKSADTTEPLIETKAVTAPAKPRSTDPLLLLQFIASKGGVKPDGDLKAMDLDGSHRVNIPGRKGRFGVVKSTGMSLDAMRGAAQEAGYFPEDNPNLPPTSSVRDFLNAIDNELRGIRRHSTQEEHLHTKRELERIDEENAHREAILADNRREIEDMAREAGVPSDLLNQDDVRLAAEIMADEGLSPDDALERAAIRNLENSTPPDVTADEIDIIYGWGATDAVQPDPAQDDVQEAARASRGDGRSGEEGGVAEPRADVSGVGDDLARSSQSEAGQEAERTIETPDEGTSAYSDVDQELIAEDLAIQAAEDAGIAEYERRAAQEDFGANDGIVSEEEKSASRKIEDALDKIEEAVEEGDRKAVIDAARAARKVLAETPKSVKDADPDYWNQFNGVITKMTKPGYVTATQQYDREIADAPTWAQMLHKLPMLDERNRDTDLAFKLMASITGGPINKQKFDNLTGPQRHELLKLVSDPFHNSSLSTTEKTEAGEQTVLPGAEKIGDGELAQRKADEKLKSSKAQKPADEGLFGDDSKQADLLDAKPQPSKLKNGERRPIGNNADGEMLYEDARGVRSLLDGNARLTEAVGIKPDGGITIDRDDDRFKLASELDGPPTQAEDADETKAPEMGSSDSGTLADLFAQKFLAGEKFQTILVARKLAKETFGIENAKEVEEQIELGIVKAARDVMSWDEETDVKYQALVDLYASQPKLGTRTSTSMRDQAFSTPVPLAYVASELAGITRETSNYEPSAGNGALLIAADPDITIANEISSERRVNLINTGFRPIDGDAASAATTSRAVKALGAKFERVIANPPFGAMKEDGKSKVYDLSDIQPGYKTTQIDHVIALRALAALRDDGRATLIVGGLNKMKTSRESRSDGYNGKDKREFYKTLYDRYNVVDHFTVAGELYERQGAGWPVDVIVIDGRGKSARKLPAVDVPRVYSSWDQLGELLDANRNERTPRGQDGTIDPDDTSGGTSLPDEGVRTPAGGRGLSDRVTEERDAEGVRAGSVPDESRNDAVGAASDQDAVQSGERGDAGRSDPAPVAERRASGLEQETERQVAYKPRSDKTRSLGTLVPVNMRSSLQTSLQRISDKHGSVDDYVARELGYKPEELEKYFGAEQIDALALAIDNLRRGKGFIIGDQTGIGKGRVNAAIIRWAIKNDRIPVFVTEKPNLYGDMYRDLQDIGISDDFLDGAPRILATNADVNVPLTDDGKVVLKTPSSKAHNDHLATLTTSNFGDHYDMVFTNYSQMQTLKGENTPRRGFLSNIVHNAVLIFDESHNAGGQDQTRKATGEKADRAGFARDLVSRANGVFYSSATYAKRPDVMDLYSATDMSMAVSKPSELGEAIAKGGVPMQQVVATMLAQAGQYVRRERSFAGVSYNTPVIPVDRAAYDGISRSLASIQQFSDHIKTIAEKLDEDLKGDASGTAFDNAVGDAGAKSVAFTSVMHNIINQMLLAMKVKGASAAAIQALKDGKKPVITLANTMESFLTKYAEDIDLAPGGVLDADFSDVLNRYLERTRTLLIKKPYSKKGEIERKYLSDKELGFAVTSLYNATKAEIAKLDLSDLPVSPIDAIKDAIQKAGYSVGEITGRGTIVDYSGDHPILKNRPGRETSIRGRRETIADFNSGKLDAVILNQAGATGLSLHASEKFKDQRRRKMIIAQAEANIDTHMQMLGRVHRTGQVVTPEYDQLVADIPAEKRPAAVLAKKMASLNANTTASRGGALTAKDVPDFINQYGDMVAGMYIGENPMMNARLGQPIKFKDNGGIDATDAMRKVTGRIPLLPLKEQEDLYEHLETEYDAFLKQMEASGENALEAKTYDLKAKTLESTEVVGAKSDLASPFAAPVMIDRVSAVRLGKPYPSHEVVQKVFDTINERDQFPSAEITKENAAERYKALLDTGPFKNPSVALTPYKIPLADFTDYRRGILDDIDKPDRQEKERVKLDAIRERWTEMIGMLPVGARVTFKTATGNLTGIVTNIEQKGQPKNPLALSSWKVTAAIADATRQITVPVSRLWPEGKADGEDPFAVEVAPVKDWLETNAQTLDRFDHMQSEAREERFIATGNLLAAYDWLNKRGRIINYTDDEGHIRQGILTPADFDLASFAAMKPDILHTPREIVIWLQNHRGKSLWSQDQVVRVTIAQNGQLIVSTDSSKKTGGTFFLDRPLTNLTGDFIKIGGTMRANTWNSFEPVIERLQGLGAVFVAEKEPKPDAARAVRYSIRPGSKSLDGVSIKADGLTKAIGLAPGDFWANYRYLSNKHPEYFKSAEDAQRHVESVLSQPDVAIPQLNGFIDLIARMPAEDRMIGFRAELKGGRYNISTAYVLDPGQLDRMKNGAARAGRTVLELNVPSVIDPAGRTGEYSRVEAFGQAPPPALTPEKRANLERALTNLVRRIVGPAVEVRFPDTIPLKAPPKGWGSYKPDAQTAAGSYMPAQDLLKVALNDPAYPLEQTLDTTFHEAFHAVENRLLTDEEMEVFQREDARLRQIVRRGLDFTEQQAEELAGYEVRALAFELYAGHRARGTTTQGFHMTIRRAFERLMQLFREIGNYMRGLGFRSADSIMKAVYEGKIANRAQETVRGDEPQFNIRETPPRGNLNTHDSFDPLPENWKDWWSKPDLKWSDRVWGMIDAAFLPANRAIGDKYVDMRRMQAAVEATGRPVRENIDMALNATLFEGRAEKRLKDYWLKTWKPVLERASADGVSREDLHTYLYARHAPERNARIAEINPAMPNGGSGMTNAEAQEIMDGFQASGRREALERAAQDIDRIVARIRATMVADQLEHESTLTAWRDAYQHYVPLQGFEAGDETIATHGGRSGGFDVRGAETKKALGRSSKADDILSNLFLMGERTIIRGEQNRVARSAMRFMQSNPQPSLYTISRAERVLTDGRPETTTEQDLDLLLGEHPVTVTIVNRNTGMVETVTKVASSFAKDTFAAKVGGHTYYITIKHPGLLAALKNVGVQRLPMLIRAHAWLTRQFSAFRTARNPDWFIANLSRDIQDAAYTVTAEQRSALLKNFAVNIASLRTYMAAFMGEAMEGNGRIGVWAREKFADKRGAQAYEEWKKAGGQIAFMGIHDLESAKDEIEKAFNMTAGESWTKSILMAGPHAAHGLLKAIEFFNGAIEAGTRLAVFDAAIKAGMSRAQAARLSKESTTNFNRKGIYSPFINSFYAFFNARVQGAIKHVRLLRTSQMARRAALGLVIGGFATTMWNLTAAPDDEDKKNKYAKRKYWERERYFILYMPGSNEPYRLPMGFGLQLFWMLGENIAMLSQGKIGPAEAAVNYLSTIVGAFSPFSAEGSPMDPGTWLRMMIPSIEMPLLELSTNENWRRKPIHPKFGGKGQPHSDQYYTTTSPLAIDLAQFLNRVSGGDAFRPGKIDLYPGDLQYMWEFAAGGLGQTVNRTDTMIRNWANGVETPTNQIPVLRHFVGQDTKQSTGEAYYEDREAVQKGMSQVRKAMKSDANGPKADDAFNTIEAGQKQFGVKDGKRKGTITSDAEQLFRGADKELKDLRAQESRTRADPTMSRKEKSDLIAIIRENMRQVQEETRQNYRKLREAAQ